jgi:large subunit ribosomal protein L13
VKTFVPQEDQIKRTWYLVDAKGKILGRLASQVAHILMGKHKPTYQPNFDMGDFVVVINAGEVKLTGQKERDKIHYWHTGYVGHIRAVSYGDLKRNKPEYMFWLAVKRMLPRNKLRNRFLRKLKIYAGAEHPHAAQQPTALELGQ